MIKESSIYSFPANKNNPVQIELMSCDWQSLKEILKFTAEGSERPIFEEENQAIQRLLSKIAEQPFEKEEPWKK